MNLCEKVESAEDGVGVTDSNYLIRLAETLELYSQQLITNTTGQHGDRRRQKLLLGAGNVVTVVRGVRSLASARSVFSETPCSYDEVYVSCRKLRLVCSALHSAGQSRTGRKAVCCD